MVVEAPLVPCHVGCYPRRLDTVSWSIESGPSDDPLANSVGGELIFGVQESGAKDLGVVKGRGFW